MGRTIIVSFSLAASLFAIASCSPTSPAADAAHDAGDALVSETSQSDVNGDTASTCHADRDCSDGVFCNGTERCMPGATGANAQGCLPASPAMPCAPTQQCDEANARCLTVCTVTMDADHDGHNAIACGGDDCDDADANRFPGNAEICAFVAAGTGAAHRPSGDHDEDCNPLTLANAATHDGDHDGDGFIDLSCSNVDSFGGIHRGDDCDDADPMTAMVGGATVVVQPENIHPTQPEVCNGVDDNCDGRVDDGVQRQFFADMDHDNYGEAGSSPVFACTPPANTAETAGDCNDMNSSVHPGAIEACNGIDDDCNGIVDDGAGPALVCASTYGSPSHTQFGCTAGHCSVTCPGTWSNCDGALDNGCETNLATDVANCGSCGNSCSAGGVCTAAAAGSTPPATCDTVDRVHAGGEFTCIHRTSGSAACWGSNWNGQLGDGTAISRTSAAPVSGLVGALDTEVSESAGFALGFYNEFACARLQGNTLCWGDNSLGQLGNGLIAPSLSPTSVAGFPLPSVSATPPPVQISVGATHVCGAEIVTTLLGTTNAVVYCWGNNTDNQLGNATAGLGTHSTLPVLSFTAPSGTFGLVVAAGQAISCALPISFSGGTISCWGRNDLGQLGDGTTTSRAAAAAVRNITTATDVVAGAFATCARIAGGQVWCWGGNSSGQLGDGTTVNRTLPVRAGTIVNAAQLALGYVHTCARTSTGAIYCWGDNTYGQLGDGTTTTRSTPVLVAAIPDAIDISAGPRHTCAVRADHSVWCWGSDAYGEIGDGTTAATRLMPTHATVLMP